MNTRNLSNKKIIVKETKNVDEILNTKDLFTNEEKHREIVQILKKKAGDH
jgi:hypothetical protein